MAQSLLLLVLASSSVPIEIISGLSIRDCRHSLPHSICREREAIHRVEAPALSPLFPNELILVPHRG